MTLEMKRFKNIVAFKLKSVASGKSPFAAFHAENMEVGSVTSEVYESISHRLLDSVTRDPEVLAEIKEWNQKINHEEKALITPSKIKSVNINVTQICNLHCTYCAAGGDGTYGDPVKQISIEKTLPQLKFFMEKLSPGDRFHISFLGGEPLLYPEGIELIAEYVTQMAREKSLRETFKITTNGTLLNEKILSILKNYKPTLVISMDGEPEINDRLRPQRNKESSSKMILENLQKLILHKADIGVLGVHAVFSKENLNVVSAYHFFSEFPFDFMDFMFSVTENDFISNLEFMEQMEQVAALAWSKGQEEALRKIYIFDHYFDLLDDQRKLENHCGLGKTLAVLDSKNRIYNCPWTVGDSQDQLGQDQTLNETKLASYKPSLIERNNCHECWAKYLCGGGCSFIHKSTHSGVDVRKNELFCERTRYIAGLAIYYFSLSRELMT